MKVLNLYRCNQKASERVRGFYVRFEQLAIDKQTDRRAFLQSIAGSLCRRGFDVTVAPSEVMSDFDLVLLNSDVKEVTEAITRYSNLSPRLVGDQLFVSGVIEAAWQNKVRAGIVRRDFIKIGDRYILKEDILNSSNPFKRSYRVQSSLESGYLGVWVDARTRIMRPLTEEEIHEAESMGDESEVKVRVLPKWHLGILVGKTGKKADDMEFPYGERHLKTVEYWKAKHGIDFINPKDDMLEVHIPSYGKTLPYPRSCVFTEYKERTKLPETLKKEPDERINCAGEFVKTYLSSLVFLSQRVAFEGPLSPQDMGFSEYAFAPYSQTLVVVGSNYVTSIDRVHEALKQNGPYSGTIDGKYIVIHFGKLNEVKTAVKSIQRSYERLNLGKLEPLLDIGEKGFIDTGGDKVADYTSAIAALRSTFVTKKEKVLALIILPSIYASDVYFRSRDQLFERIFGTEPFPCQAFGYESVEKIIRQDRGAYAISANTASQCYVKFGGTGTAVWILKDPADIGIPGIQPGSSCYAYHDVSRRQKLKASATAYSALTDSYGRYIATGTRPVGGEKLAPSAFYDIMVELIQKVSIFGQRFMRVSNSMFNFSRMVFAKDGVIRDDEADMMESVILNGIPEENKEPVPSLLKRIQMYPKRLVIDIIGVNKTPNKRIFDFVLGHYFNVKEGTAIAFDDNEGLLVSCSSKLGSAQPIEISLKKHLCLNIANVPKPHISQIMDEYYRLTRLNWSSLFKQGKYALPQILTQNLGEDISAGVRVPDDMVLL